MSDDNPSQIMLDAPWWEPKKAQATHMRLVPYVREIYRIQETRYRNMRKMNAICEYGFGVADNGMNAMAADVLVDDKRLYFNWASNAVQTLVTKVCGPRIMPMALTEGGNYASRQKAKDITQACEAVWDEAGLNEIQEDVITDAAHVGIGWIKAFPSVGFKKVCFQRINPLDVVVDDNEGRDRKPRSMFHIGKADRFVVLAEYGGPDADLYGSSKERTAKIKAAPAYKPEDSGVLSLHQIEVFEAWHLPSRASDPDDPEDKGSRDGLHTIAIDGCTLFEEEWTEDRFPLEAYIPIRRRTGFYGLSIARQLAAGQRESERMDEKKQRAHRMMGSSSLIISRQAKPNWRQLANGQGQIIDVDGDPNAAVREFTPSPMNPQSYDYSSSLPQLMLNSIGLSPYAAQSQIPAQLQQASGKALDLFESQDDKRLTLWHTARERLTVNLFELTKMVVRRILKENPDYSVKYNDRRGYRLLKWKDIIDVPHVIRVSPVGGLSQDPAHKIGQLTQLLNVGAITPEQFKRIYGLPDIEAEQDIDEADTDIIDRSLDRMVMTGKYVSPEPFDNLKLIVQRAGKFYNMCRDQDVPDDRLELIRQYIADTQALLAPPPAPPAANDNGAPPMMPGGQVPPPMAPPNGGGGPPAPPGPMSPPMPPPGVAA